MNTRGEKGFIFSKMRSKKRLHRRSAHGLPPRRGSPASYTVEAALIMAIVLVALAQLLGAAFNLCREETALMRMQHAAELVRSRYDEQEWNFSAQAWSGKAWRDGSRVKGLVQSGDWQREIEVKVHEPENMMRMLTLFDQLPVGDILGRTDVQEGDGGDGGT